MDLQIKLEPSEDNSSSSSKKNVAESSTVIQSTKISPIKTEKDPAEEREQSTSKIVAPPPLQKSVIVAPGMATLISNVRPPILAQNPNIIQPAVLENLPQRLVYVMKQISTQAGAMAQVLPTIRAPVVLPPPPPLKRIPGRPPTMPGLTVSFPTSVETPPLIPKIVPMQQTLKRTVETRDVLEKNGFEKLSMELGQTSQTVDVDVVEDAGVAEEEVVAPAPKKRKRKKKPSLVRPPTEQEIKSVNRFKQLFREGHSSSSTDDASADSNLIISESPTPDEIIVDVSSPTIETRVSIPFVGELPPPKQSMVRVQSGSASMLASGASSSNMTEEELEEHRLRRARNNEAVRKSRLKARMKIKQSELNCRVLVKQFGELKTRIENLEKELAWERRKNEILEEMLRRTQAQAASGTTPTEETAA